MSSAGKSRGVTAGSALAEGDFSYDVHPFRFPSATGITPKLVTSRGKPRERAPLGMFSQNTAVSSFGGKHGESRHWLTPRGEIGGHLSPRKRTTSYRHPSGSQTERGRDRRADRPRPERERPKKGLQNVQGVTWRFLREGPRRKGSDMSRMLDGMRGSALDTISAQDAQFDALVGEYEGPSGDVMRGTGMPNLAAEYRRFEQNVQRNLLGEGKDPANPAQHPHTQSSLSRSSSSSSSLANDDGDPAGQRDEFDFDDEQVDGTSFHTRARAGGVAGKSDPQSLPRSEVTKGEQRANGADGTQAEAGAGGAGSKNAGSMDYEEDGAYLANPAMAPCVIWHTPMRVKIAANLPNELRAEINDDDTFVKDQRVVPDIWDHQFLPVTRRSVAAPLPVNSAKHRANVYGAWYLPVDSWGAGRAGDDKRRRGLGLGSKKYNARTDEDEEEMPELMEKAFREIVKLPSSKMFYAYIKSQKGARVPHYLKKLEEEERHT